MGRPDCKDWGCFRSWHVFFHHFTILKNSSPRRVSHFLPSISHYALSMSLPPYICLFHHDNPLCTHRLSLSLTHTHTYIPPSLWSYLPVSLGCSVTLSVSATLQSQADSLVFRDFLPLSPSTAAIFSPQGPETKYDSYTRETEENVKILQPNWWSFAHVWMADTQYGRHHAVGCIESAKAILATRYLKNINWRKYSIIWGHPSLLWDICVTQKYISLLLMVLCTEKVTRNLLKTRQLRCFKNEPCLLHHMARSMWTHDHYNYMWVLKFPLQQEYVAMTNIFSGKGFLMDFVTRLQGLALIQQQEQ